MKMITYYRNLENQVGTLEFALEEKICKYGKMCDIQAK